LSYVPDNPGVPAMAEPTHQKARLPLRGSTILGHGNSRRRGSGQASPSPVR